MKKATIILAAGALLLLGTSFYYSQDFWYSSRSLDNSSSFAQASLDIDFAGGEILRCNKSLALNSTVFDLLKLCLEGAEPVPLEYKSYGEMGIFVNIIGERKSGDDGRYWQYRVNGIYSSVAADKYIIQNGDEVFWKFALSEDDF